MTWTRITFHDFVSDFAMLAREWGYDSSVAADPRWAMPSWLEEERANLRFIAIESGEVFALMSMFDPNSKTREPIQIWKGAPK